LQQPQEEEEEEEGEQQQQQQQQQRSWSLGTRFRVQNSCPTGCCHSNATAVFK